jgi:hypothetical protein
MLIYLEKVNSGIATKKKCLCRFYVKGMGNSAVELQQKNVSLFFFSKIISSHFSSSCYAGSFFKASLSYS